MAPDNGVNNWIIYFNDDITKYDDAVVYNYTISNSSDRCFDCYDFADPKFTLVGCGYEPYVAATQVTRNCD